MEIYLLPLESTKSIHPSMLARDQVPLRSFRLTRPYQLASRLGQREGQTRIHSLHRLESLGMGVVLRRKLTCVEAATKKALARSQTAYLLNILMASFL